MAKQAKAHPRARASLAKRIGWAMDALTGKVRTREASGAGFAGAEGGRLLGDWASFQQTPDDTLRFSAERLRARAQDLERNSPLARHYLRLMATNVIGATGATLRPMVRDNSGNLNITLNRKIRDAWDDWCYQPTLDGRQDMASFQRMLLKCVARDGEALVRKWRAFDHNPYRFALEYVDPTQLDYNFNEVLPNGAEIRMGVEVDASGRVTAYHLWSKPQGGLTQGASRKRIRVPADQIIHLYEAERGNQSRGVTWMASVMVPTRMLEGYREAVLVNERMAASKMLFFQRKQGEGTGALVEGEGGKLEMDFSPGTMQVLPDGYEVASFDPTSPGAIFGAFVKDNIRGIATGLGVSYNGLASDLEGVNYSSIRSGMLSERDMWKVVQDWWAKVFLRPVYAEWMSMALLSGALVLDSRDPRKFLACKWRARGWDWVDPLKDTQAAIMGISAGLDSRTRALAEKGESLEDVLEELAEEQELAKLYGVNITPAPAPAASKNPAQDDGDGSDAEDDADTATDAEDDAAAGKGTKAAPGLNGHASTNGHGWRSSLHIGMARMARSR